MDQNLSATLLNFDPLTGGGSNLTQAQIDTELNGGQDTLQQVYGIPGSVLPGIMSQNPTAAAFTLLDPGNTTLSPGDLQSAATDMQNRLSILSALSQNPADAQQFPDLSAFTQLFTNLQQGTNFLLNHSSNNINGQVIQQLI